MYYFSHCSWVWVCIQQSRSASKCAKSTTVVSSKVDVSMTTVVANKCARPTTVVSSKVDALTPTTVVSSKIEVLVSVQDQQLLLP